MGQLTQRYEIVKDVRETFYFKVFFFKGTPCYAKNFKLILLKDCDIIKEIEPLEVSENGIYFLIGDDVPEGKYNYDVAMITDNEYITLLNNRRLIVTC